MRETEKPISTPSNVLRAQRGIGRNMYDRRFCRKPIAYLSSGIELPTRELVMFKVAISTGP
jgi:hypothetical protein